MAVFAGKPIIGIAGGIGSGKSFVAGLFGELGCLVLSADDHVNEAYQDPAILEAIHRLWGDVAFESSGKVDRAALAKRIFTDPAAKKQLESLIHPWVARRRDELMRQAACDSKIRGFVWDVPLLFEVGLDQQCDAIVFVEATVEQRLARVGQTRGWNRAELERRENLQTPLDNKRRMSKYIILNTADVGFARSQVQAVLSDILAQVR